MRRLLMRCKVHYIKPNRYVRGLTRVIQNIHAIMTPADSSALITIHEERQIKYTRTSITSHEERRSSNIHKIQGKRNIKYMRCTQHVGHDV